MQYIVEINYYKFVFDDAEEAMAFAKTAMEHGTDRVGKVEICLAKTDTEESEVDE